MKQHMAAASFGQKIAISGGAAAVVGGLTANELAAICGAIAGLGGLGVQIVFTRLRWRAEQRDKAEETKRKEELHALEKQQRQLAMQHQQLEIDRLRTEVNHD